MARSMSRSASPEEVRQTERVATSGGARTSIFAPLLDRFFVAARAGWLGPDAAILVCHPSPLIRGRLTETSHLC
jgi:hypothetical protein